MLEICQSPKNIVLTIRTVDHKRTLLINLEVEKELFHTFFLILNNDCIPDAFKESMTVYGHDQVDTENSKGKGYKYKVRLW